LGVQRKAATVWLIEPGDHVEAGCFTCAIRSYQAMDLSALHSQADIIQSLQTAKSLASAFYDK
jgi:hypothetical protein